MCRRGGDSFQSHPAPARCIVVKFPPASGIVEYLAPPTVCWLERARRYRSLTANLQPLLCRDIHPARRRYSYILGYNAHTARRRDPASISGQWHGATALAAKGHMALGEEKKKYLHFHRHNEEGNVEDIGNGRSAQEWTTFSSKKRHYSS